MVLRQYIIDEELLHRLVNIRVRLVHVFVNLELTVNHPDPWLERKWRIGCDESWVRQWDELLVEEPCLPIRVEGIPDAGFASSRR